MEAHIEENDLPVLEDEADSASEDGTPGDDFPGENGASKKRKSATCVMLVKTGKRWSWSWMMKRDSASF
jgi:hypothetical protein